MRFALRNQRAIKSHFEPNGQKVLERILNSLKKHFERTEIETTDGGERFPLLVIDDIDHSVNCIVFYVIHVKYDVYKLAFKEFLG